jgi:hypothetical protein
MIPIMGGLCIGAESRRLLSVLIGQRFAALASSL